MRKVRAQPSIALCPSSLGHKNAAILHRFHLSTGGTMCSDYLGDLLRLRNILAALARPAPTIASQGVSLATAASKTLVSSLLGGGLRGRVSAIKASSTSAIASNAPPA